MAVVAEPVLDLIDDRLAARNAVILGVAQALAGGNNTVIVATTGIIGSMLAPDPGAGDLADQCHGRGHVDGDVPGRHAGQGLWPALRACRPVRRSARCRA